MYFSVAIRAVITLGVIVIVVNASVDLKAICNSTTYPKSCYSGLSPFVKGDDLGLKDVYKISVKVSMDEVSRTSNQLLKLREKLKNVSNNKSLEAITYCIDLLSNRAMASLNDSLVLPKRHISREKFEDLKTYLTAAGVFHQLCIDGLDEAGDVKLKREVVKTIEKSIEFTSNSLAILYELEESVTNDIILH